MDRRPPLEVMGDIWERDTDTRTPLGMLIAAAKDRGDHDARRSVASAAAEWAAVLELPVDAVVVPVPPSPDRPAQLVAAVAAAIAAAAGVDCQPWLTRTEPTERLRDVEPADRAAVAARAGYGASAAVRGRHIVIVDDVVMTGTTLDHVAGVLFAAGAKHVSMLAIARSRRV